MANILYTIIIYPIIQIIGYIFVFTQKLFRETGVSIICVSGAVSLLCLPLYMIAEKWQKVERNLQKQFAPKIAKIKAVFKGDERYMIVSAYYRQNHYHPVYALRSSFGLLVQIPFFIAAYSFLSHLEALKGASFFFIKDLSVPDSILRIRGISINILPIAMTVINCVSGIIYTRGFPYKDKIQIYGLAAVFLILLYESPSGLTLYWTLNNIFSLLKNLLQKTQFKKLIIFLVISAFSACVIIYALFFHSGALNKRFAIAVICLLLILIPLIIHKLSLRNSYICRKINTGYSAMVFIGSITVLFLLAGLVIPGAIIASSVVEFSFIKPNLSPFPFIFAVIVQSFGIFVFWPLCIFFLCSARVKNTFSALFFTLCALALFNTFVFSGDYGFLTPDLKFSNSVTSSLRMLLVNLAVNISICAGCAFIFIKRKMTLIKSGVFAAVFALLFLGVYNCVKISSEFKLLRQPQNISPQAQGLEPVYKFSRTGKNALVIMLDRAISGYVRQIFTERPELYSSFTGFIYYPNCVSFSRRTNMAAPALFGGYEYTPMEMNKRKNELFYDKYNEAMLILPALFTASGFSVTLNDMPVDDSIYKSIPHVSVEHDIGKYNDYYLQLHQDLNIADYDRILRSNLIRFSLFKSSPLFFRSFIYDYGYYLQPNPQELITPSTLDSYTALYVLPETTRIIDDDNGMKGVFNIIVNLLTHESGYLQAPDYIPLSRVSNYGDGPYKLERHYHVNIASFLLLSKWFDFLKKNNIYDNTRIVIVSDHGRKLGDSFPQPYPNIRLPYKEEVETFNSLLMVKDFNASGMLVSSDDFMTCADIPLIVTENIIENPVNPFTGKILEAQKAQGVVITRSDAPDPEKYTYNIKRNEWLYVKDFIFDDKNWTVYTP